MPAATPHCAARRFGPPESASELSGAGTPLPLPLAARRASELLAKTRPGIIAKSAPLGESRLRGEVRVPAADRDREGTDHRRRAQVDGVAVQVGERLRLGRRITP